MPHRYSTELPQRLADRTATTSQAYHVSILHAGVYLEDQKLQFDKLQRETELYSMIQWTVFHGTYLLAYNDEPEIKQQDE